MRHQMSKLTLLERPACYFGHLDIGNSPVLWQFYAGLNVRINPAIRQARNKVRNNNITRGYYAATPRVISLLVNVR